MQFIRKMRIKIKNTSYIFMGCFFMIIIQKKRLIYISLIVLTTILICGISTNKTENTVQTVALPVTNKVIVLDAGHGVPDEGAESSSRNNRGPN